MIGNQSLPNKRSMWDEILSEYRSSTKNEDKHVLMVGPKFAGKRAILNDLFQMNGAYTGNDSKSKTNEKMEKMVSGIHNDFVPIKNPDDSTGKKITQSFFTFEKWDFSGVFKRCSFELEFLGD